MIRMLTFWSLPEWMDEPQFEQYFAGSHAVMARYMEGFRRYAVNRRLRRPPAALAGPLVAHHMSENWWDSLPEMERCFNSWGGLADFGDTVAREIMVPRTDMVSFDAEYRVADCVEIAILNRCPAGNTCAISLSGSRIL